MEFQSNRCSPIEKSKVYRFRSAAACTEFAQPFLLDEAVEKVTIRCSHVVHVFARGIQISEGEDM